MSLAAELATFFQVAQDTQTTRFLNVACAVVLAWDILTSLDQEIELFWKKSWGFGKILFLSLRWPVLVEVALFSVYMSDPNVSADFCLGMTYTHAWSSLAFYIPVQLTLFLRTIAMWNMNRIIILSLIVIIVATDGVIIWTGVVATKTIPSITPSNSSKALLTILGCNGYYASGGGGAASPYTGTWIALMIFDTSIFVLTITRSIREARNVRSRLFEILIRDGFMYYTIMLVIAIVSFVFEITLSSQRAGLKLGFLSVIRVSMATVSARISLNVRSLLSTTPAPGFSSTRSRRAAEAGADGYGWWGPSPQVETPTVLTEMFPQPQGRRMPWDVETQDLDIHLDTMVGSRAGESDRTLI